MGKHDTNSMKTMRWLNVEITIEIAIALSLSIWIKCPHSASRSIGWRCIIIVQQIKTKPIHWCVCMGLRHFALIQFKNRNSSNETYHFDLATHRDTQMISSSDWSKHMHPLNATRAHTILVINVLLLLMPLHISLIPMGVFLD